jgi:Predicted membrane-bound mannosyltransferase
MNNSKEKSAVVTGLMSDKVFLLLALLVTAVGTALRFIWLGLKPFHHDEGVNGVFLNTLVETGNWAYDPSNYHGPDLYYISLISLLNYSCQRSVL